MKYFASFIIAVVAAAIVAGFFIVGSPQEERLRRFDDRRVGDLQTIQAHVVNFWQTKSKLPEALDELTDTISGFKAPRDPAVRLPYEYRVSGPLSFELCATFARASDEAQPGGDRRPYPAEPAGPYGGNPIGQNWEHAAGLACFARAIDPDFYRPREAVPVKRRD